MAIQSLTEGMKWSDVFDTLNALIAEHNSLMDTIGKSLSNGKIDYQALANIPLINGIRLLGDLSQADLSIETDAETRQQVRALNDSVASLGVAQSDYVERIATLESGRTADLSRISTLEGAESARATELTTLRTEYNAAKLQFETLRQEAATDRATLAAKYTEDTEALEEAYIERYSALSSRMTAFEAAQDGKISELKTELLHDTASKYALSSTVAALDAKKANASDTPTVAQWNTLKSEMDGKVAQAQAAANSAPAVASKLNILINQLEGMKVNDCTNGTCKEKTLNLQAAISDAGLS